MVPASGRALKADYFVRFYDLARGIHSPLSLFQPLLGAIISLRAMPSSRVLLLGLIAATAGYFAVFSLNDILDRKTDRKSIEIGKAKRDKHDIGVTVFKHPLARGEISLAAAVTWVSLLTAVSGFFAYLLNPLCLLLFAGCVILETVYCLMRTVSWTKTIVTGIMVAMGGLAGWVAVAPLTLAVVPFFLFLAFWEIFGRNLANDLADVESDKVVGLRTVATTFGNRTSAAAILIGSWAIVIVVLTLPIVPTARLVGSAIAIWAMGIPSIALVKAPTSIQASTYFNRASLVPMLIFVALLPFLVLGYL
ncbi:MAG: UbiA prenyltransferase family protein [Firmicutes bacterium]|nr:UbiA prenyltransferase family protein [Bacillota bacterium]